MMNKKLLLLFISSFMINGVFAQYCEKARNYTNEDKQIQALSQDFYMYKCACSEEGLSEKSLEQKVIAAMTHDKNSIKQIGGSTSHLGNIPRTCKIVDRSGNSGGSSGSHQTPSQQKFMKTYANYNKAMGLKNQGIEIAKAFSKQVRNYGQLNKANTPEALLQNFNNNMQAIADLQTQNKADNLNQLTNTLNSTVNDLNSGNHEGAMFSVLSLLDQSEAKREAKREAENMKWLLNYEKQNQMAQFFKKALELNYQAINQYYEKAAYAYNKEEETYLLEYVNNLECHKEFMKKNFNYSSTSWTQNKCAVPEKRTHTVNNLIAKDIQYINAAKRKYELYKKTGEPIFQQGAMRFAGLAATENPKTEYYYLMGHFAGVNNPLVAYSSFLSVESKNSKYFAGENSSEYAIIKMSLELSFKKAIEENHQEVIKNIVGAGLHQHFSIDGYLPIIYALKIDQADVVYAFLSKELEGKPQSIINKKVQSTLYMAALLDAPNTIQKFVDLGFSIDFSIDDKTLLDAAEEALALKSFNKISELLGGQSKYNLDNSDLVKINEMNKSANLNDTIKATHLYEKLGNVKSMHKALLVLLNTKTRSSFFAVHEANKEEVSNWSISNRTALLTACFRDIINRNILDVYKYFTPSLLSFDNTTLVGDEKRLFNDIWSKYSLEQSYFILEDVDTRDYSIVRNPELVAYLRSGLSEETKQNKNLLLSYLNDIEYMTQGFDNGTKVSTFDSKGYPIDLLEFAVVDRRDPKLTKQILINTTYNGKYKYNFYLLLSKYKQPGQPGVEGYPEDAAYPYQSGITEMQIAKELFSHFTVNEKSMDKLVEYGCIQYRYKEGAYRAYKDLFDSLINQGYKPPYQSPSAYFLIKNYKNYRNHKNFYWIKQDKKYWKAIYNGDYAKRY